LCENAAVRNSPQGLAGGGAGSPLHPCRPAPFPVSMHAVGTLALLVLVLVLVLSRFAMQIVLLLLPFRVLLTHVVGSCGEICHRLQRGRARQTSRGQNKPENLNPEPCTAGGSGSQAGQAECQRGAGLRRKPDEATAGAYPKTLTVNPKPEARHPKP
jgi:hypothetical protein